MSPPGMVRRAVAIVLLLAGLAPGAPAAETARQILDRRKALEDGPQHWSDRHQRMKLTIVDRRGGERVRELEVYDRRYSNDESKTIVFFHAPPEVDGTGFLAFTHKGKPADQWLYLPALQRVRQITARSRQESFMGTDLSYADLDIIQEMSGWSEAEAASRLREDEVVDGAPAHVIELAPRLEHVGYEKIVLWLGKEDLVPRRLEFWADADQPRKRIAQREIRPEGAIPVAHRLTIETPAAASRTEIAVSEVRFNQGLEDDLFSQRFLERGGR
jgi:outer membrane lipoprotein-sorting protein